jgi:gamma-glutamyltranspeptidase/glutathione hydrolase
VATPHALASEAGLRALRRGGNALDAAIAAAATIAVVYPHMNGIGGDNVWLIHDAAHRRLRALNAIGRSAAGATLEAYRTRFGAAIPPRGGAAALTVPGTISGWWQAHTYSREAMGSTLGWAALLEDAITHARDGFPLSSGQRRVTAAARDLFGDAGAPEVRRTLWPTYHPQRLGGARFVQADLGATLARVAEDGPETFYRGALARRIVDAAAAAGSPLTLDDLAARRRVATSATAERLAERAGQDVDPVGDAVVLGRAPPPCAEHADRVRVVDHHQRLVALREVADLGQRRDVAVHGEDAVGRDQPRAR